MDCGSLHHSIHHGALRPVSTGNEGSKRKATASTASSSTKAAAAGGSSSVAKNVEAAEKREHRVRALVRTLLEIAQGMAHLHSAGLVHGDLKPGGASWVLLGQLGSFLPGW